MTLISEAIFLRALAWTHWMSSANAWRSDTGRVRGTERGAERGTVGGVRPFDMPWRMGVNIFVAGGAECCRGTMPMALSVGGETRIAGGASEPKKSAGGSIDQPTHRPHVGGAPIAMDGELVMVEKPATVVLKK